MINTARTTKMDLLVNNKVWNGRIGGQAEVQVVCLLQLFLPTCKLIHDGWRQVKQQCWIQERYSYLKRKTTKETITTTKSSSSYHKFLIFCFYTPRSRYHENNNTLNLHFFGEQHWVFTWLAAFKISFQHCLIDWLILEIFIARKVYLIRFLLEKCGSGAVKHFTRNYWTFHEINTANKSHYFTLYKCDGIFLMLQW